MVNRQVYIYGTGRKGKSLMKFLKNIGVEIVGFLKSRVDGMEEKCVGVPVFVIDQVTEKLRNGIILLAFENFYVRQMVKLKLLSQSISSSQVIDCTNFINENNIVEKHQSYCIFCGCVLEEFIPAGIKTNLFSNHHIIGGGYRTNSLCPKCGSIDRERWLYYVLLNHTDVFEKPYKILHFAPERNLKEVLLHINPLCQYYSADLTSENVMFRVDMTSINFQSNSFDYVIANHVLEHIEDEERAVDEIKRVLKPSGKIILSFPINVDCKTYEDATLDSQKKLELFGQEDHVRLYGYDYKERFENYGLQLEVVSPIQELPIEEIEKYGFIKDDVIIICEKN